MDGNSLVNFYRSKFDQSPEVILDIGTHDLRDALILANSFPTAKVYAFEAHPQFFNVSVNNNTLPDRVTVYHNAVSDIDGQTNFYLTVGTPGASSLLKPIDWIPWTDNKTVDEYPIECVRIDTWANKNNIDKIDLMWMDVQGSELMCLQGVGKYISDVKMIQTEIGTQAYYQGHTLFPEVHDYLVSNGFELMFRQHDWSHEDNVVYINKKFV